MARDIRNEVALKTLGWRIAIVWECALRTGPERSVEQTAAWLLSELPSLDLGG